MDIEYEADELEDTKLDDVYVIVTGIVFVRVTVVSISDVVAVLLEADEAIVDLELLAGADEASDVVDSAEVDKLRLKLGTDVTEEIRSDEL